jgi:chorismate mutase-like protein
MKIPDISELRIAIDSVDQELIILLARRLALVEQVGKVKKEQNLPALQQDRWLQVLEKNKKLAEEAGISEQLISDIWELIHREALKIEEAELQK